MLCGVGRVVLNSPGIDFKGNLLILRYYSDSLVIDYYVVCTSIYHLLSINIDYLLAALATGVAFDVATGAPVAGAPVAGSSLKLVELILSPS